MNLDEGWRFHFGHAANPEKDFNYGLATIFSKSGGAWGTAIEPRFADSSWRRLNLPHDWAVELPFAYADNRDVESHGFKPVGGLFPETSIGWYRRHFTVSPADSGMRFQLQFDGVFRNASVWVNGFYMGTHLSGYTGVNYDITDVVRFGQDNVIVVRVDATQYEGWFYEGAGIYRHVWLNQYDNLHVADGGLFVFAELGKTAASIHVETTVTNQHFSSVNATVYSLVTDRSGQIIGQSKEQPLQLAVNGQGTVRQQIEVKNPIRWTLDQPYLYRVVTVVKKGNQVVDIVRERFGIRTLRFDGNEGFFLNEQPLKIFGTNNHQDHAGVGSALPDALQYYRVKLLKNLGVNAYRTSHHPPTQELLEACDSLGMLVLDENRSLNSSAENLQQLEWMIRRDRNHPSVFLWSIGNEEGWIHTNTTGKRIAQTLLAKQRELDPTRLSTYAADVANVYHGINEVIPVRGFNYRQYGVADYHRDHPDQPILGTEMGSTVTTRGIYTKDSVRGYLPDEDLTAPWWASTAETWTRLAIPNPYWMGGFIWTGFDYRGEPTPFSWPNINSHFGILDMCGFPKNVAAYYQSWWTDKDVLQLSPHWNWREKRGKPIDVWVNSNADDVELFLNGKSLGKKEMPRLGHLQWTVSYEPGKLEAVAYKKGKKLTTAVETTGAPAEVVVTPYKTTLLADGQDVSVINISVTDAQGREVPDAENPIRFVLTGPGRIIGVGNGDPSSHEPDICVEGAWQRSLFNGKCQLIVQSTHQSGSIHLEAKANGLWTGSTDINTVAPGSVATVTIDPGYQLTGEAAKPRTATPMLGADISFLPELESRGIRFSDQGREGDAIHILKSHGFNYVRLRLFNEPAREKGYSPGKGFCDLEHTLAMARRIKAAGMKWLLDYHYSDYWADPGKQYKPEAWKGLSFAELKKALYTFTRQSLEKLRDQGSLPDMVQVGNEINHGFVWPEGDVRNVDSMCQLVAAGIAAVKAVDPRIVIMVHMALGGQNEESVFFIDQLLKRSISFDVIGLSYYPKWHGTLADLENNMQDLIRRYNKDLIVVEYSARKKEVNQLVFGLPGGRGKGSCIWEPLNTWEQIFDRDGKSNELLTLYDEFSRQYLPR